MTGKSEISGPTIEWADGEFRVSFPLQDSALNAGWRPSVTTVARIRKAETGTRSLDFETPLHSLSLISMVPTTEYEVWVTRKNAVGEGLPDDPGISDHDCDSDSIPAIVEATYATGNTITHDDCANRKVSGPYQEIARHAS